MYGVFIKNIEETDDANENGCGNSICGNNLGLFCTYPDANCA